MILRTLSVCAALVICCPVSDAASSTPIISSTLLRGMGNVVLPVVCDMRAPVICMELAQKYCRQVDTTAEPKSCSDRAYARCLKAHRCDL